MFIGRFFSKPFLVVALIATTAGLTGCKQETAPKPTAAVAPQPIRVMTVSFATRQITHSYSGTVKPRVASDLGFRVAGKIVERLVDVGGRVKEGDVIARLDATDYKLTLESQQAELRAATSTRDQAVAAEQRYRELLTKGHVSTAAAEQRTATADEARQRVEKAVRAIETATHQVAYTELKADGAGVVAALPVEVGQVVAAGQTVARVARSGEVEVQVAIPEQQLEAIKTAKAEVELWSSGTKRYEAILREVSPEADAASRSFLARFTVLAAEPQVALGMTATVFLRQGDDTPVARLPLPAVMNDGRGASVYAVDDSGTNIKRTPVNVVAFGREEVTIASGVQEGQRIVTLGTHLLDDNRAVRIVEQEPARTALRASVANR